jgi:hypothetical protein
VAVVVPDEESVSRWRSEHCHSNSSAEECALLLKKAILEQMKETGRRLGLAGFELVYAGDRK